MKTIFKILLLLIGLGVLVFGGLLIYVFMTFGPDTSTDVADYADILKNKWDVPELVRHFPTGIPKSATNVKMSYSSRFLQGGAHFQLRLNLPQAEFNDKIARFSGTEEASFTGGDCGDHANLDGGAPTTDFFTGDGTTTFSDDYVILLLYISPSIEEAEQWKEKGPFWWNHGDNYGIAHNRKTNTIVYWAESW